MPSDALGDVLELVKPAPAAEASESTTGRGLILYTGAAEWQQFSPQVEAVRDQFDGIKVQLLTNGPLTLFAQQLPTAKPINLLQGRYTPQATHAVGWRAWRVAAMLLFGIVALHAIGKGAELFMLKSTEKKVNASIEQAFRAAMPGETNTTNARRRMETKLVAARSGGGTGLLLALGAFAEARNSVPGTTVQSMSFHDGALTLKMAAPDADALDRLNQALRSNGWQADLTAGSNVSNGYEGRIQIRPLGAS
jgi:type II secretion system protein L